MRSIRAAIRKHRGQVLVRAEILLGGQGLAAADQVHPKLSSETPPAGWVGITKAAAYRLLDTSAQVYTWENAGAIGLEVERTPATGKTRTEVEEETYRTTFQPEDRGNPRAKPPTCSQGYGSCIPEYTYAPGRHRCGISGAGQCPVEKSVNRARSKARKRLLGLWKRSIRVYRRRLEAQAVEMEYPIRYLGLLPAIAGYPDSARIDRDLYLELRKRLDLRGAVDVHMMLTRPMPEKREYDRREILEIAGRQRSMNPFLPGGWPPSPLAQQPSP